MKTSPPPTTIWPEHGIKKIIWKMLFGIFIYWRCSKHQSGSRSKVYDGRNPV
ncbi:MAG: hypothetical protein IPK35_17040 [Saprospiraceae bacterium]|nr:hypothetical protein [Saprospiraceae bacterium]